MTKPLIVIGARLNSSRLSRKHFLGLAGKPLIQRLVDRLKTSSLAPDIVIATTADSCNSDLIEWSKKYKVNYYAHQGDIDDLIGRINTVVSNSSAKQIVYICGDCPLIDVTLIDKMIQCLREHPSAETVAINPIQDSKQVIHEGISAYSIEGWGKLVSYSNSASEKEHVGSATKGRLRTVYIDDHILNKDMKLRLSVDTPSDSSFMKKIYENWYALQPPDSIVDLQWVVDHIAQNPTLAEMNQHVMQKQVDISYKKAIFITEASPQKGLGQLSRSTKIAARLIEEYGIGVELLILGGEKLPPHLLANLNSQQFSDENELLNAVHESTTQIAIFDIVPERLRDLSHWQKILKAKRNAGSKLIGIDQAARIHSYFHQVIVPSHYIDPILLKESDSRIEYGWQYVIGSVKHITKDIRRDTLLILTGSGDSCDYGQWLPTAIDRTLVKTTNIVWVQGPFAQKPEIPESSIHRWELYYAPEEIEQHMARAAVAVSVYGSSVYELLSFNVPTVVLPAPGLIDDQEYSHLINTDLFAGLHNPREELSTINDLLSSEQQQQSVRDRIDEKGLNKNLSNIALKIATV